MYTLCPPTKFPAYILTRVTDADIGNGNAVAEKGVEDGEEEEGTGHNQQRPSQRPSSSHSKQKGFMRSIWAD